MSEEKLKKSEEEMIKHLRDLNLEELKELRTEIDKKIDELPEKSELRKFYAQLSATIKLHEELKKKKRP